jgi:4-hydroxythreonine-4-phosphate dehydrogenase
MIKIGITHGDINGIGYEVIIKTLLDQRIFEICTPILYGSPKVAAYHRKALDIENMIFNNIRSPEEAIQGKASVINCVNDEIRVELGKSTQSAGEASRAALMKAVDDLKQNHINAIVTAPINKQNIQSDDFRFAGHTEFLQYYFNSEESLMLMASEFLKVGLVCSHIPVSEIPEFLSQEGISSKIRMLNDSLMRDFGIRKPRIAVLGLNPHAGEEGMLGKEENEKIIPAINESKENNLMVFGPFPADGFFGSGDFNRFDGILAMYHDQGLIPFKTIVPDEGVNFTAGLPIIRTSPAHGTAFEIAGLGQARSDSFRKALYMACDIHKNRQIFDEISKDPLPQKDLTEFGQ